MEEEVDAEGDQGVAGLEAGREEEDAHLKARRSSSKMKAFWTQRLDQSSVGWMKLIRYIWKRQGTGTILGGNRRRATA